MTGLLSNSVFRQYVSRLPRGRQRAARWLMHDSAPQVFLIPHHGYQMYLDPRDPFQREMACGVYHPELMSALADLVKPGDNILNAGAHVGYLLLWLAQLGGRVIGFEADRRTAEVCEKNIALNPKLHCTLVPMGLGAEDGTLQLWVSDLPSNSSFAYPHLADANVAVRVRKGDEVLHEFGVDHLDGLVLDLEGWEMSALEGMRTTLEYQPPRWAVIECADWALQCAGSSENALRATIASLGLEVVKELGGDLICTRSN
jgi:FkbM family methyltransferase